jgi:hypothetical protein
LGFLNFFCSVILFPIAVTFYVTWWFFRFVDGFFSPIYAHLGINIFGMYDTLTDCYSSLLTSLMTHQSLGLYISWDAYPIFLCRFVKDILYSSDLHLLSLTCWHLAILRPCHLSTFLYVCQMEHQLMLVDTTCSI